jgi:hypothetical protein
MNLLLTGALSCTRARVRPVVYQTRMRGALQSLVPQQYRSAETSVSVFETFAWYTGFSRRIPVACRGFVTLPLFVKSSGDVDAQDC